MCFYTPLLTSRRKKKWRLTQTGASAAAMEYEPCTKFQELRYTREDSNISNIVNTVSTASLVHIYKLIKLLSKFVDHNNEVYLFQ